MKNDPIIDEIHQVRKKIEKDCKERGEDLMAYFLRIQEQFKDRVVSLNQSGGAPRKKSAR